MVHCSECGFDWDGTQPGDVIGELRVFPQRYRVPLTRFLAGENSDILPRVRPAPAVWSALEYAAHTRDALEWYAHRIQRVLDEDRPQLTPFDFEAACEDRRYNDEDVTVVVEVLANSAEALAGQLVRIDQQTWDKVGVAATGRSGASLRSHAALCTRGSTIFSTSGECYGASEEGRNPTELPAYRTRAPKPR